MNASDSPALRLSTTAFSAWIPEAEQLSRVRWNVFRSETGVKFATGVDSTLCDGLSIGRDGLHPLDAVVGGGGGVNGLANCALSPFSVDLEALRVAKALSILSALKK